MQDQQILSGEPPPLDQHPSPEPQFPPPPTQQPRTWVWGVLGFFYVVRNFLKKLQKPKASPLLVYRSPPPPSMYAPVPPPMMMRPPLLVPQVYQAPPMQMIRTYKSGWKSAQKRFEQDAARLAKQGWRVQQVVNAGMTSTGVYLGFGMSTRSSKVRKLTVIYQR